MSATCFAFLANISSATQMRGKDSYLSTKSKHEFTLFEKTGQTYVRRVSYIYVNEGPSGAMVCAPYGNTTYYSYKVTHYHFDIFIIVFGFGEPVQPKRVKAWEACSRSYIVVYYQITLDVMVVLCKV